MLKKAVVICQILTEETQSVSGISDTYIYTLYTFYSQNKDVRSFLSEMEISVCPEHHMVTQHLGRSRENWSPMV